MRRRFGWPVKLHAEQVVDLAFVPVGGAPDVADGGHFGHLARLVVLPARQHHLEHEADFVRHAPEVIDDLQVRLPRDLRRLLRVRLEVVDDREIAEHVEPQFRLGLEMTADFDETFGRDFDPRIERFEVAAGDLVAEPGFETVEELLAA